MQPFLNFTKFTHLFKQKTRYNTQRNLNTKPSHTKNDNPENSKNTKE